MPDAKMIPATHGNKIARATAGFEKALRDADVSYFFVLDITTDDIPPQSFGKGIILGGWQSKDTPSLEFVNIMPKEVIDTIECFRKEDAKTLGVSPSEVNNTGFFNHESISHPCHFPYWACGCGHQAYISEPIPDGYPVYRDKPCETCGRRMILTVDPIALNPHHERDC